MVWKSRGGSQTGASWSGLDWGCRSVSGGVRGLGAWGRGKRPDLSGFAYHCGAARALVCPQISGYGIGMRVGVGRSRGLVGNWFGRSGLRGSEIFYAAVTRAARLGLRTARTRLFHDYFPTPGRARIARASAPDVEPDLAQRCATSRSAALAGRPRPVWLPGIQSWDRK